MSQKRGNMIENIIVGVIVALVIIVIVAWIIRGMIQKKKRSGTFIGCDCGCANCPHSCHIQRIVIVRVAAAAVAGASLENV